MNRIIQSKTLKKTKVRVNNNGRMKNSPKMIVMLISMEYKIKLLIVLLLFYFLYQKIVDKVLKILYNITIKK
jgi:hypothetical protein